MKRIPILLSALVCLPLFSSATLVRLDNTGSPGLGDDLDEINFTDTPSTVAVPEIPGLTITVVSLFAAGDLNATATSLGINDGAAGDDTDAFDAAFNERVTLNFNLAVSVTQLDFTTFETGEVFNFGGTSISNGDLSSGTTDVYDFAVPLVIPANTNFSLEATAGTIGIEAFDLTVVAVPEPTSLALMGLGTLLVGVIRRRFRA